MAELAKKDEVVTREEWSRDDAVEFFKGIGEKYKAEIIASIPSNETLSLYREGEFIDLCRGPHVPSTGKLKVFKLMKVAGAYWRGDSKNEMLQRIYGTAWATRTSRTPTCTCWKRLSAAITARSAANSTCSISGRGPGLIFWHPKGWALWQQVEQYMRGVYRDNGYQEVKAPQILDISLWKKTGHWDNYRENMFTTESENRVYGLKPMNCPGHVQIFNAGLHSYRELPLRYGEFGQCHRNEPSGSLHGMMRARLHPGRRPHFLYRGTAPGRVRRFHGPAAEGLPRLRLHRGVVQGRHASREAHRLGRGLGHGRIGADGKPAPHRLRIRDLAGRGRLLRPRSSTR